MKTYTDFKNWVKATCIDKSHGFTIYSSDTAHAIFSAWYMFKHNLTGEQIEEYLKKDVENSKKTFTDHGITVRFDTYWVDEYLDKQYKHLIPLRKVFGDKPVYNNYEGGGEWYAYGITGTTWKQIVKVIYEYWYNKLIEEEVGNENSK